MKRFPTVVPDALWERSGQSVHAKIREAIGVAEGERSENDSPEHLKKSIELLQALSQRGLALMKRDRRTNIQRTDAACGFVVALMSTISLIPGFASAATLTASLPNLLGTYEDFEWALAPISQIPLGFPLTP